MGIYVTRPCLFDFESRIGGGARDERSWCNGRLALHLVSTQLSLHVSFARPLFPVQISFPKHMKLLFNHTHFNNESSATETMLFEGFQLSLLKLYTEE